MPDDEEQPGQGAVAPGAGGIRTSPGGIGSAPSAGSAPAPKDAGGQFATLQSYLNANQGQAAPLANKITSGIQNQYNTLQGQNQSALNDINSQVSGQAIPNASDVISQEAANPVSFANDSGNVKNFQNLLGATYSGPVSAEGTDQYQKQQASINNAIATGTAQTGTEAGREQLLSQNERRPTTGVTALNSAILTQSPDYLNQVQEAYKPFSNLLTGLQTGAQGTDQTIAKTQGDISSANAAANKQIADQVNALNTNVNTEYGALQNKYNSANTEASTLASNLQNGTLPVGYGVDPGLQSFINSNINPWVSKNAPGQSVSYNFSNAVPQFTANAAPTLEQAATAQDYAQAQAFQNLLAGLPAGPASPIINPTTASQAGTYNLAALPTINNTALAGDIYGGLSSVNANVGSGPFQQYINLLAALDKYQGKMTDPNLVTNETQPLSFYYPNAPTIA